MKIKWSVIIAVVIGESIIIFSILFQSFFNRKV